MYNCICVSFILSILQIPLIVVLHCSTVWLLAVMQPTIVEMMSLLFTPVNVLMVEYGGLPLPISLAIKEVLSQFCIMHLVMTIIISHMCGAHNYMQLVTCVELTNTTTTILQYSDTVEGSLLTISCLKGYYLPGGDMMSVCTNGSWSPNPLNTTEGIVRRHKHLHTCIPSLFLPIYISGMCNI